MNSRTLPTRRRRGGAPLAALAALLLLALCLAGGSNARAAVTRIVTTLQESGPGDNLLSLREAIEASASGDRITFAVSGNLDLFDELAIERDLVIVGPGARRLTVRRAPVPLPPFRCLRVGGPGSRPVVSLSDISVERGRLFGIIASGGGISNVGSLALVRCAIRDNSANGNGSSQSLGGGAEGGGIYNDGALSIRDCEISGNAAVGGKGAKPEWDGNGLGNGIYNRGTLTVVNSTISGNLGEGGGLYSIGAASLTNCTIAGNSATKANQYHRAGGILTNGGVTLRSTIVARNVAAFGTFNWADVSGQFTSAGYNLVGKRDGATNGWLATDRTGSVSAELNPRLEEDGAGQPRLRNNGGPTNTVALLPASAALDAGDDGVLTPPAGLPADQRGLHRRIGAHVDIGAYERDLPQAGAMIVVNTLDDETDGIAGTARCSLREAIEAADADTSPDTITFRRGMGGSIILDPDLGPLRIEYPLTLTGPGARNLTVSGGRATRIFLSTASPVTISGLTLAEGLGSNDLGGGGAVVNGGMMTLRACVVRNNLSEWAVSTLYNDSTSLQVRDCTFSANLGGALMNAGSTLYAVNCTLSGNTASGGGGVFTTGYVDFAVTTLLNCTVAGNTATDPNYGGGGLFKGEGNTLRLRNTLVALNTSAGPGPDVAGAVGSLGNNLVGKSNGSTGWLFSDRRGTVAAPLNPRLGPLAANGGPTNTRALLAGSPALNAAHNTAAPPKDQRGYERPNTADIGAFELGGIAVDPPVNVSVTPSAATGTAGTARTLAARYADPNGVGDLKAAYLLVNSSRTLGTGFYAYYEAAGNRLYLRNAANTGWVGGAAPGAAVTLNAPNGAGALHCAQTTVSRSGDTLTVNWRITPNPPLAGSRNVYLNCQDRRGQSAGWEALGTWSIQTAQTANCPAGTTALVLRTTRSSEPRRTILRGVSGTAARRSPG